MVIFHSYVNICQRVIRFLSNFTALKHPRPGVEVQWPRSPRDRIEERPPRSRDMLGWSNKELRQRACPRAGYISGPGNGK